MAVAKSFQSFQIIKEPHAIGNREYVMVKNPKTGTERQVRWYSEKEYLKLYPGETITNKQEPVKRKTPQKEVLGFTKGYITIFKGDTAPYEDWFNRSIARYHVYWGWYVISTKEVPSDLPEGLTPVQLNWDLVGKEDGFLKSESQVKEALDSILYEASKSIFVGEIGERLELELTVTEMTKKGNGFGGDSTTHIMKDKDENVYIWVTSAKTWETGTVKKLRGTVKEHKINKNTKVTVLTRCTEVK